MRPIALAVAIALAGLAALLAATRADAATLVPVATFDRPMYVTAPPGDDQRLFVVQRTGKVMIFRNGATLTQPFLNLSNSGLQLVARADGERGTFSIAFPPDYAATGLFYIAYSNTVGDFELDEFSRSATNPDLADPTSRRPVLTIPHARANHYGGQLQFGPDNLLYISTGDGGGQGDPDNNGQNVNALLGKVLRIDPRQSGADPYTIPADNPFVGVAGSDEIWAYGFRNPWRFSFDRLTGDMVIGDVGQEVMEEVDFALAGTGAGANYGWRRCEGTLTYPSGNPGCPIVGNVQPVATYKHNLGRCSITGGYVVRNPATPDGGRYLFGDYCTGELRVAKLPAAGTGTVDSSKLAVSAGPTSLDSFGEDAAGCVYVVQLSGAVSRFAPNGATSPGPCALP